MLEAVVLALLVVAGSLLANPLGGFFWILINLLLVPRFSRPLFRFVLTGPLHLSAAAKLAAWALSASGVLLGVLVHSRFWGLPNSTCW